MTMSDRRYRHNPKKNVKDKALDRWLNEAEIAVAASCVGQSCIPNLFLSSCSLSMAKATIQALASYIRDVIEAPFLEQQPGYICLDNVGVVSIRPLPINKGANSA